MKQLLILLLAILGGTLGMAVRAECIDFSLEFDERDYQIVSSDGIVSIQSRHIEDIDLSDGPMVPMRKINIAILPGMEYCNISLITNEATLIGKDIEIAAIPEMIPTSELLIEESDSHLIPYSSPELISQFCNLGTTDYQQVSIFHCALSPFMYDVSTRNLYFYKNIEVSLSLGEKHFSSESSSISPLAYDLWSNIVINPDDLATMAAPLIPLYLDDDYQLVMDGDNSNVDYVIITNNALESSFSSLINWKKTKGLRCQLITVESIDKNYTGKTVHEKIKRCLHSLYQEKGLSYALLGGDASVVPTPMSKGIVSTSEDVYESMLPTDLYYACFRGQFDWDLDGNDTIGGLNDNCNFIPDIIVTRLPVSTSTEVTNTTRKIISYEKTPIFNKKILFSGVQVDKLIIPTGYCDSYNWSNYSASNYVAPYWDGTIDFMFDTSSQCFVTNSSLAQKLSSGYSIASFQSHGSATSWQLKNGNFTTSDVPNVSQQFGIGTIITTTACHTNWFDSALTCLSKAFLTSYKSGVVGYFGSSRYGWYNRGTTGGKSCQYENQFYHALFNNPDKNKSFGRITTLAKLAFVNQCNSMNAYRWLQFSINPIGDPEMPIFVDTPKTFSSVSISPTYIGTKKYYTINSNEPGCNICITGELNGQYAQILFKNVQTIRTPYMPADPTICITKQNFKPYIAQGASAIQPYSIDDKIISCELSAGTRLLNVSTQTSSDECASLLSVTDILGDTKLRQPIDESESTQLDLNGLNNGVYVITLTIDGANVDSRRIILK